MYLYNMYMYIIICIYIYKLDYEHCMFKASEQAEDEILSWVYVNEKSPSSSRTPENVAVVL